MKKAVSHKMPEKAAPDVMMQGDAFFTKLRCCLAPSCANASVSLRGLVWVLQTTMV
jgi:hypothetical protein